MGVICLAPECPAAAQSKGGATAPSVPTASRHEDGRSPDVEPQPTHLVGQDGLGDGRRKGWNGVSFTHED